MLNGPRASQQTPDRHQSHHIHITSLRQETKLPKLLLLSSAAAPLPLPSPSPSPLLAVQPLSLVPHQPQHSLATPFDAPSPLVNPSNPRSLSPSISHFSYYSPSPPICCPPVLVAKRLDISDPITSSPCTHIWPAPAPAFAFAALVPSVQRAWRLASHRQTPAPHIESNLQAQAQAQSPIPNPTSTDKHRITLRPGKSRQSPTTAPPPPPLSLVFSRNRNSSAYSEPVLRPGTRSAQASSGVPYQACCYRSASSAASNLTFALCSGSHTRSNCSTGSPFCCTLALCHSLKPPTSA
jgi:hypothetical protein